ncbi:alpha/beta-hydrolase [Pluteus cervinus]|uniref:Alpha/beta-hydrolase n=1 Tax=Pluteus cervinus TaxID=181527 RepID=A0ACD3B8N8_9AGAR|nr:alpha/beta-hydrolase [Pluteus cervinus]
MTSPFHHQPLKGLYLLYRATTTLLIKVPLWTLLLLPKSARPRPAWTIKRALWLKSLKAFISTLSVTGPLGVTPDHHAITPGPDVNGVWVKAASQLVHGDLEKWATESSVIPVDIPGYWLHKKGTTLKVGSSPSPGEKVILALHGGAYVRLSAHPSDLTSGIVRGFLKHIDSVQRVFSIEYRLSSGKPDPIANPFPAALLDALAAYNYLVTEVGFAPENILVEGDSAGANLALALTRYLVEYGDRPGLPAPPGGQILLSPWTDLSSSHYTPGSSAYTCHDTDYITLREGGASYAQDAFFGPQGRTFGELNRYVSPSSLHPDFEISFAGFPRTFIVAGGAETMLDQIRTLRNRMARDLGEGAGVKPEEGKVTYHEATEAVHDFLVFKWHEPERTDTLKAIAKWVAMTEQ